MVCVAHSAYPRLSCHCFSSYQLFREQWSVYHILLTHAFHVNVSVHINCSVNNGLCSTFCLPTPFMSLFQFISTVPWTMVCVAHSAYPRLSCHCFSSYQLFREQWSVQHILLTHAFHVNVSVHVPVSVHINCSVNNGLCSTFCLPTPFMSMFQFTSLFQFISTVPWTMVCAAHSAYPRLSCHCFSSC